MDGLRGEVGRQMLAMALRKQMIVSRLMIIITRMLVDSSRGMKVRRARGRWDRLRCRTR